MFYLLPVIARSPRIIPRVSLDNAGSTTENNNRKALFICTMSFLIVTLYLLHRNIES